MPTVFEPADDDVRDLLAETIERYFDELHGLAVPLAFDVLMAADEKGEKPALKRYGQPCAAIISIVKPEERATGEPDVRLKICKVRWDGMDAKERSGLLHHELAHLVPKYDKDTGSLKLDPYGRPVVKCRPDDFMLTGFYETIRIFGAKATERQSLDAVEERIRQGSFGFMGADQSAAVARAAELDRAVDGEDPELVGFSERVAEKFADAASRIDGVESIEISGGSKTITIPARPKQDRAAMGGARA